MNRPNETVKQLQQYDDNDAWKFLQLNFSNHCSRYGFILDISFVSPISFAIALYCIVLYCIVFVIRFPLITQLPFYLYNQRNSCACKQKEHKTDFMHTKQMFFCSLQLHQSIALQKKCKSVKCNGNRYMGPKLYEFMRCM